MQIGEVLNNTYKILAEVGHGATSTVYLALNEKANKQWAIKELSKDDEFSNPLMYEIEILKSLKHEHLPSIVDIIEKNNYYYIVMDYIEGVTLRKKIREEGALPEKQVVDWMVQICDVLEYLHEQTPPIIYRDLKPSNIMLKPNGDAVLIDFGAAREFKQTSSEDTQPLGTPGYAAPEQYEDTVDQSDARTDIYTVGATMFHLLTGKSPQFADSKFITDIDPHLSTGLESIIVKCMAKEKADRFQTCTELKRALLHYKDFERGHVKKIKRQLCGCVFAFLLGCLCIAGSILGFAYKSSLTQENYDYNIRMAKSASSSDAAIEYYRNAISIDASNGEAYTSILSLYLEDNEFTTDEADELIEILGYTGDSNTTNESVLKTNQEDYDAFAFQLGLAYFYYQDSGKKSSEPWFAIAKESEYLSASQVTRAEILYNIAGYYADLTSLNLAGDSVASYATYFEDLTSVLDYDIVAEDNVKTALVIYNEIVTQIINNARNFQKAGIEEEEMQYALDLIERHIETDVETAELDSADEETLESIKTNMLTAATTLEATFQEVE